MKAVTVQPGVAGSVRFEEVPEPDQSTSSILVQAAAVGICGADALQRGPDDIKVVVDFGG